MRREGEGSASTIEYRRTPIPVRHARERPIDNGRDRKRGPRDNGGAGEAQGDDNERPREGETGVGDDKPRETDSPGHGTEGGAAEAHIVRCRGGGAARVFDAAVRHVQLMIYV